MCRDAEWLEIRIGLRVHGPAGFAQIGHDFVTDAHSPPKEIRIRTRNEDSSIRAPGGSRG